MPTTRWEKSFYWNELNDDFFFHFLPSVSTFSLQKVCISMQTPSERAAGCSFVMLWRHVGEWRQTGTSGRELDKSRWRPTLKQERDVINKTHSETSLYLSATSTRRRLDFERKRRSRYRWEECVSMCGLRFVSGAVAEQRAVYPFQPHNVTARPLAKLTKRISMHGSFSANNISQRVVIIVS